MLKRLSPQGPHRGVNSHWTQNKCAIILTITAVLSSYIWSSFKRIFNPRVIQAPRGQISCLIQSNILQV